MGVKIKRAALFLRNWTKRSSFMLLALILACSVLTPVFTAKANGEPVNVTWTGASAQNGAPDQVQVTDDPHDATKAIVTIRSLWIEIVDSVTINNTPYNTFPIGAAELLAHNVNQEVVFETPVPKAPSYNVVINTHEITEAEQFIGNFLWENDENAPNTAQDDIIGHGTMNFVKAVYNGVTYNSVAEINAVPHGFFWNDGDATHTDGGAVLPVGTELTIKLIPEAGYQLTSFGINGGQFEPQENIGEYTFTIRGGNGHFAANFSPVDDAVDAQSEAIDSGTITLGGEEGSMENGTAKLEVTDANISDEQVNNFESTAAGYTVSNYLDISLYNTIYKGSADDAWDTEVTELDNEATITLKLAEGVNGNEVVIVHEKHDGTYEIIPATYDPVTHTITFKTSSFSNYAIATRGGVSSPDSGVFTGESASATAVSAAALATITGISFTIWFAFKKFNQ